MTLLVGRRVVVVDVETTGWNPEADAIVEIARVTLDSGEVGETWSSLIQPGRPVPPDAVRIHGITDAMLAGAPAPAAVVRPFAAALEGATLTLHNASFDLPFLEAMLRRHAAPPFLNPVIDTLGLARGLYGAGGNSLAELARRHGLEHMGAHRALADARATAELLVVLARLWETERGVRSLPELAAASQDAIRLTAKRGARTPATAGV